MNPDELTAVKVAARNWQVQDSNGNPVTDAEGTPLRFKTQHLANEEIEASKRDAEADAKAKAAAAVEPLDVSTLNRADRLTMATREDKAVKAWHKAGEQGPRPATPALDFMADPRPIQSAKSAKAKAAKQVKVTATRDDTVDAAIAAMTAADRLAGYKAEIAATRTWQTGGEQGDRPATPIMVWMRDPNGHLPTRESAARVKRTPEQDAQLTQIIEAGVEAGATWLRIAEDLMLADVPAAIENGVWWPTAVRQLAGKTQEAVNA
jgi:hypothetical protein